MVCAWRVCVERESEDCHAHDNDDHACVPIVKCNYRIKLSIVSGGSTNYQLSVLTFNISLQHFTINMMEASVSSVFIKYVEKRSIRFIIKITFSNKNS